jgi:LacI family transcriptional regulator
VAALAGVSIKTVSRVINGESRVTEETAAKVHQATRALRYLPDAAAAALSRSSHETRTIALLIASVGNPFSSAVFQGVEEVATARHFAVFAASTEGNPETEERLVRAFLSRNVDGLIITPTAVDHRAIAELIGPNLPNVYVDRDPLGIAADVITANNREAARLAVEHLIAHGHHRIAAMTDQLSVSTAVDRRAGYIDALIAADIPLRDEYMIADIGSETDGFVAMEGLLALPHPPTALFASRNMAAIGAIRVLQREHLEHQIALIGMDDIDTGDLFNPPLSVMRQDPVQIGRLAAERLFARIDNDTSLPQQIIVPAELVARGSGEIRHKHGRS